MAGWFIIYGFTSRVRGDAYYSSPFVFLVIDLLQVAVIVMALFAVGGYDRSTETRSLAYATEHLLAIIVAAVVSSAVVYLAATYDQTMKPSRGVILLSFIIFLPVSLEYRRWLRGRVSATIAERAFLVIGSGELVQRFYEAYKKSPNRQRLEFVDVQHERIGDHLAGTGSPIVEGDIETKLGRMGGDYSGVILADRVDHIPVQLVERLVRTQFQKTRVYSIESFYESQWRYVPVDVIDQVWPLQAGFQLARNSPYHYLKRLCDLLGSMLGLLLFAPILALCATLIWLECGRPILYCQNRIGQGGEELLSTSYAQCGRARRMNPMISTPARMILELREWVVGCANCASMSCRNSGTFAPAR